MILAGSHTERVLRQVKHCHRQGHCTTYNQEIKKGEEGLGGTFRRFIVHNQILIFPQFSQSQVFGNSDRKAKERVEVQTCVAWHLQVHRPACGRPIRALRRQLAIRRGQFEGVGRRWIVPIASLLLHEEQKCGCSFYFFYFFLLKTTNTTTKNEIQKDKNSNKQQNSYYFHCCKKLSHK